MLLLLFQIQDMVAIRHSASNSDQRSTLILLCEDGSLRIYMANVDNTNYWMSQTLQPHSAITVLRPVKKKKVTKVGKGRPTGQVSFPVDFFEHCQQSNDIEVRIVGGMLCGLISQYWCLIVQNMIPL